MRRMVRLACLALVAAVMLVSIDLPVDAAQPFGVVVLRGRDGATLTIQADRGAADAGAFTFVVPGSLAIVGADRAQIRDSSTTHFAARYSGPADVYRPGADPVRASIVLEAEVEREDGRTHGEAKIAANDREFHLETVELPRAIPAATLTAFENATRSGDWAAVYQMLSADFSRSITASAFVDAARAQVASLGPITSIRRLAIGQPQVNDQGIVYATVQYAVTRSAPQGSISTGYVGYFVLENGRWRLWYTAPS